MENFSKAAMVEYLEKRIESLVDDYDIDIYKGSAQTVGKSDLFKIAYGKYVALRGSLLTIDGVYIGR